MILISAIEGLNLYKINIIGEAALSASILASEGKTYNQKPPPQSIHYGFPNTG